MGDVCLVRRQLDTLRSAATFRKLKKYITPLLAAGAAVVLRDRRRTDGVRNRPAVLQWSGSGTVCLSPSNVPIKSSPPDVRHHPSGEMPDLTVFKDFALALGLAT